MDRIEEGQVGPDGVHAPDNLADALRALVACRQDLAQSRAELVATQLRLEQSEEHAAQLQRVRAERNKIAAALAGYLARPPALAESRQIGGWRGWLVERWIGAQPTLPRADMDPRIEQIESSPLFDAAWYLHAYPDVATAGVRPAVHYLYHGAKEGRSPGPGFDSRFYLARYEDVRKSGINPLIHYMLIGADEGRLPMHPQPGPAGAASRT